MKTAIFLIALFCLGVPVRAQEIQPGTRPDKTQRELLKRGYGMFIHYGMNTFLDKDWSEGVEPASTYHPTQLDCDQWVRIPGGRFPICRIGDQAPRRFLLMGQ